MAIFYDSIIAYDDASTAYNGVATAYSYSGSITVSLLPHYALDSLFYYPGHMVMEILASSMYRRGFVRVPATFGFTMRVVPNSSMVIRQYKKVKDPVRIGGCPQCGVYTYDQ